MMKAELTAKNRPAYECGQRCAERGTAETHEDQGGVDVLVVLLHVFGIVLWHHLLIDDRHLDGAGDSVSQDQELATIR